MEADIRDTAVEHYYPSVISNAKEFIAIAKAENPEFDKIWFVLWKWMLNTFVFDVDEDGASRWEKMLNIRPHQTDSLEDRKLSILAKINNALPYTHRRLEQILDALCGPKTYDILLNYMGGEFYLRTLPGAKGIDKLYGILRPILPANLGMIFEIIRKLLLDYNIGIVDCRIGKKTINIPKVSEARPNIYVGIADFKAGKKRINIAGPSNCIINLKAGIAVKRVGKIEIGGVK